MYRLTNRRLSAATTILEKYRAKLFGSHQIEPMHLEQELRDLWDIGYQELKDVMIDMLKTSGFNMWPLTTCNIRMIRVPSASSSNR
jgi:hypothetical protein